MLKLLTLIGVIIGVIATNGVKDVEEYAPQVKEKISTYSKVTFEYISDLRDGSIIDFNGESWVKGTYLARIDVPLHRTLYGSVMIVDNTPKSGVMTTWVTGYYNIDEFQDAPDGAFFKFNKLPEHKTLLLGGIENNAKYIYRKGTYIKRGAETMVVDNAVMNGSILIGFPFEEER